MINNHMVSGHPADEYMAKEIYYETHCKYCGEDTVHDELYENDGVCNLCMPDYIFDQEQKYGEK